MQNRGYLKIAIATLLVSTLVLSGQTCDEGTAGQCVPGRIVSCPCADGSEGFQECEDDKTYSACTCFGGESDAGPDVDEGDIGGGDADADAGSTDTGDTQEDTAPETLPYLYLRIISTSNASQGEDRGPDIDAVSLQKAGGEIYWATSVVDEYYPDGPNPNSGSTPEEVLGTADSVNLEDDSCDVSAGFYSLGESPGYITVAFENNAEIEAGDVVTVYEVGNCTSLDGTVQATGEPFALEIGVYETGNDWSVLASSGSGPAASYQVNSSQLPPVASD